MNGNQPTPERIMQLATGGWVAGILGAAASHSLFTHLEAGADTADKLAAQAGISERGAQNPPRWARGPGPSRAARWQLPQYPRSSHLPGRRATRLLERL